MWKAKMEQRMRQKMQKRITRRSTMLGRNGMFPRTKAILVDGSNWLGLGCLRVCWVLLLVLSNGLRGLRVEMREVRGSRASYHQP